MSRRITLRNEDHEWMVGIVEGMIRKAKREAAVWVDHMPQLERIRDALYTAMPGFEELFPEEPPEPVEFPDGTTTPKARRGRPAGVAPPPVGVRTEKAKLPSPPPSPRMKERMKRGERKATLPNLCQKHPAYAAVRRPKTLECEGCWEAYKRNHTPGEYAKARDEVEKKGRAEGG